MIYTTYQRVNRVRVFSCMVVSCVIARQLPMREPRRLGRRTSFIATVCGWLEPAQNSSPAVPDCSRFIRRYDNVSPTSDTLTLAMERSEWLCVDWKRPPALWPPTSHTAVTVHTAQQDEATTPNHDSSVSRRPVCAELYLGAMLLVGLLLVQINPGSRNQTQTNRTNTLGWSFELHHTDTHKKQVLWFHVNTGKILSWAGLNTWVMDITRPLQSERGEVLNGHAHKNVEATMLGL